MYPRILCAVVLLLCTCLPLSMAASPQLLATSSSWFVSGRSAQISVSVTNVVEPVAITAVLTSTTDKNTALATATATIDSTSNYVGTLTLIVPANLAEGAYNLQVSGAGTGTVANPMPTVSSTVAVSASASTVFIDTDKSVYQPSQTVSIVAMAIDYNLKPVSGVAATIELVSPSKYKIRRWTSLTSDDFGFLSTSYTLVDEPEMGTYTINVIDPHLNALMTSATFNVSTYVLPKFQSSVTCNPAAISSSTTTVTCTVYANYTYGAIVAGQANITVVQQSNLIYGAVDVMPIMLPAGGAASSSSSSPSSASAPIYQQIITLVNGQATFTLNLNFNSNNNYGGGAIPVSNTNTNANSATSIGVSNGSAVSPSLPVSTWGDLVISAQVTESATQHSEYSNSVLKNMWSAITLKLIGQDTTFKPGNMFKALLVARDTNQNPVDKTFSFTVGTSTSTGYSSTPISVTTSNGVGMITFQVPASTNSLSFSSYSSDASLYQSFQSAYSPSNSFLSMELVSGSSGFAGIDSALGALAMGSTATFDLSLNLNNSILDAAVEATNPTNTITVKWVATCRGDIVASGTAPLAKGPQAAIYPPLPTSVFSGSLNLAISPSMSPQVKVLVYWIAPGSMEVLADYAFLVVAAMSRLSVNAQLSATQVQPGDKLDVTLTASSPSRVLLTALDQSILLLGGNSNRLQLNQVQAILSKRPAVLDAVIAAASAGSGASTYFPYYSSVSISQMFATSELTVMTSAVLPVPVDSYMWYGGGGAVGIGAVPAMAPAAGAAGAAPNADTSASGSSTTLNGAAAPAATSSAPIQKIRSFFPESWLRQFVDTPTSAPDSNGTYTGPSGKITVTAPDSITTWQFYGVGLSKTEGLGFIDSLSLKVFQPFFVDAQLPPSAVRGEVLPLIVPVSNYLTQSVSVKLTVTSTGDFNITDRFGSVLSSTTAEATISVDSNTVSAYTFYITPIVLGLNACTIKITAESSAYSDAIVRTLSVRAEGFKQSYTINQFLELSSTNPSQSIPVYPQLPPNVVDGSTRLKVTATADLMSNTIANLGQWVEQPTGCGEQNMLIFAPIIYVMEYAQGTTLLSVDLQAQAKTFMESGYARELNYQHTDYSFSAFGNSDAEGSMWLTAFVLKSFATAGDFVYVDTDQMVKIASYIASHQNADGSFPNLGTVVHGASLFGGVGDNGPLAFTAYVLVALNKANLATAAAAKAQSYLENNMSKLSNNLYASALVAYALTMAKSTSANLPILMSNLANSLTTDANGVHLETTVDASLSSDKASLPYCYRCQSASYDVEATSYYMLTVLASNDLGSALPLSKYLLGKMNGNGGFYSTQDTVMGIEALAVYGKAVRTSTVSITAQIFTTASLTSQVAGSASTPIASFTINSDNFDLLQSVDINSAVNTPLTLQVSGSGKALIQFAVEYNSVTDISALVDPVYSLAVGYNDPNTTSATDSTSMTLTPCISLGASLATIAPGTVSPSDPGMTITEIGLFTGYSPDTVGLDALVSKFTNASGVKRWEYNEQKNQVNLYWNGITSMNNRLISSPVPNGDASSSAFICVQFNVFRTSIVTAAQPAVSSIYSYYSPQQRSSFTMDRSAVSTAAAPGVPTYDGPTYNPGFNSATTVQSQLLPFLIMAIVAIVMGRVW